MGTGEEQRSDIYFVSQTLLVWKEEEDGEGFSVLKGDFLALQLSKVGREGELGT